MSAPSIVRVVRIDPYHKVYGLLVPMLLQKIMSALSDMGDDGVYGPQFAARLWGKDPNVLLLAAIDPLGMPKGFTAATVTNEGILLLQPRMDGPSENDAIREMVEAVELWGKEKKIDFIQLISLRDDPKWRKKYGFEIKRYVWEKEIV